MALFDFLTKKNYSLYDFVKFSNKHRNVRTLPSKASCPEKISLTPELWDHLKKIRSYTSQENRERSVTFFWADGDIVTTEYARGQEAFVVTKHTASLKYEPTTRKNYYRKLITVDGKIVKDYTIDKSRVPKQPQVTELFSVHTHPKRELDGKFYFNFLSETDIKSLINSNALCSGLMLDKFWLVCKTYGATADPEFIEKLKSISSKFSLNEMGKTQELKSAGAKAGLIFYHARVGGKLVKI